MGSFLSVTHGSDEPAKFLEIQYHGASDKEQPFAFVGKGITFGNNFSLRVSQFILDSGGISIKPAEGMGSMRGDCGGASAMIGILLGIATLKLPVNVIGLAPLTGILDYLLTFSHA
jgi:aminopeptidase